jgi:phosphomannomutase
MIERLAGLARQYGVFVSCQHSVKLPGEAGAVRIKDMMSRLRANPPSEIGGASVLRIRDYQTQEKRDLMDDTVETLHLPVSNVLAFDLETARILARPSGTEPKIKFYFEVRGTMGEGESLASAEARARREMGGLRDRFITAYGA